MAADTARLLILAGASVLGALGTVHLVYTFFTGKFLPREASLVGAMRATSPALTRQTTMWKAWIGFNASHSLGAILFAVIYILLAAQHMDVLGRSPTLLPVGVATTYAYLWLAHRYWFRIPFTGIALAAACFTAAAVILII